MGSTQACSSSTTAWRKSWVTVSEVRNIQILHIKKLLLKFWQLWQAEVCHCSVFFFLKLTLKCHDWWIQDTEEGDSNTNTNTHTLGCYITLHNSWLTLMGGFIGLSRGCQVRATRTAPKPQLKIDLCQIIHSTTLNKFKNIALITLSACLCAFSSEHHVSPWSCWPTCFLHQL